MKKTILSLLVAVGLIGSVGAQLKTNTFSYTGNYQTYTVPSGVTNLFVEIIGSSGGSTTSGSGGFGADLTGWISVSPGQTLNIFVGGTNGFNGGGASGISPNQIGAVGGDSSDI